MEQFIEFILQIGHLNKQQIDLLKSKAEENELRVDDYYWEAGKTVRQIGFITDGVIRSFYYNNKSEEITRYFIDENHLILPGNDIDEGFTPSGYLSAITNCTMVVFTLKDWKDLIDTIIGWDRIIQKILTRQHIILAPVPKAVHCSNTWHIKITPLA